ncbi:MAG: hypothetical protein OXI88_07890 [Gammaproteobacteria bacterium]|nr:hypothetical protein [Gammaproteobacteria bacterium]MDE0511689.1 hypothetical protein [Gammaproteobacteria bacterium]
MRVPSARCRPASAAMGNKYKTFAAQFYLEEAGFFRRMKRDIRLLIHLLKTIVMWIRAGKVRSEFRRFRAEGRRYYVDRFTPTGGKL